MVKPKKKPEKRTSIHAGVYPSGANHWQYKLRLPRQPDGTRPMETRGGFPTDQAAHEARVRRLVQIYDGIAVEPGDETVEQYLRAWLKLRADHVRPSTDYNYRRTAELFIYPYIGDIRVRALRADHVEAWLRRLRHEHLNEKTGRRGLATSSMRMARSILVAGLNHAVTVRRILPFNPAASVEIPQGEPTGRVLAWTEDELARVLPFIDKDRHALIWYLGLFLQMRPGEILALTRDDVDLARGEIAVRRTIARTASGRFVVSNMTKRESSARTIPMTRRIQELMREHLEQQDIIAASREPAREWNIQRLVFPSSRTGSIRGHAWMRGCLATLCTAAEVSRISPHGLRHTGATWLIRRGVSAAVVSQRLGHSSVAFTLSRYVHPDMGDQRTAGEILES